MRSEGYGSWFVSLSVCLCVCVCVCVDAYSATTGHEVANERYQRLQNYANLLGDFPETTAFERYAVKTSQKANMQTRLTTA